MSSVRTIFGTLLAVCGFAQFSTAFRNGDKNLLWALLSKNMVKGLAPYGDEGNPIVVKHFIEIQTVISLEDDILTMQLWEGKYWKDTRLQWDPDMFQNVSEIRIPSGAIWQPDILLYNSAEEYKGFPPGDLNVVVTFDGNVTLVVPKIRRSNCNVNESMLLETQVVPCTLKYGSWTHGKSTLDLQYDKEPEINFMYYTNRHWEVDSTSAVRNELQYSCCPEAYVDVTYTVNLRKKD